jgi:hypothetical protein
MMDKNKLNEVLETPQVHMFKHENVFGNSFKEETIKQSSDFLRLNSLASTNKSDSSLMSSISSASSTPSNSFSNNAPKKYLLFRTISQSENEQRNQDLQASSQTYVQNSTQIMLSPELIDPQNINNNNFHNSSSKRKTDDFSMDLMSNTFIKRGSGSNSGGYLCNEENGGNLEIKNSAKIIEDSVFYEEISGNSSKRQNIDFLVEDYNDGDCHVKSRSSVSSVDDGVTSSDQIHGNKKPKSRSINSNTDMRKQQIRNSNREAARRCRERRRTYIETLEANIRNLELGHKTLISENINLQKEVLSLKKIISDNSNNNSDNNEISLTGSTTNANSVGKGGPVMLALFESDSGSGSTLSMSGNDVILNGNVTNQQVLQKILNALIKNGSGTGENSMINNNNDKYHLNSID